MNFDHEYRGKCLYGWGGVINEHKKSRNTLPVKNPFDFWVPFTVQMSDLTMPQHIYIHTHRPFSLYERDKSLNDAGGKLCMSCKFHNMPTVPTGNFQKQRWMGAFTNRQGFIFIAISPFHLF